jgi:hypothetical protein
MAHVFARHAALAGVAASPLVIVISIRAVAVVAAVHRVILVEQAVVYVTIPQICRTSGRS